MNSGEEDLSKRILLILIISDHYWHLQNTFFVVTMAFQFLKFLSPKTLPVFLGIWVYLAAGEIRNCSSFIYVIILLYYLCYYIWRLLSVA